MEVLQDKREQGWFWDSNDVFDLGLSVHALVVRFFLARSANSKGEAFPSAKTIAKKCGISRRKVFDALRELEEAGLIERHARERVSQKTGGVSADSNLYVLKTPAGGKRTVPKGSAQDALGQEVHQGVVHGVHQGSAQDALGVVHRMHTKDYPIRTRPIEQEECVPPTPSVDDPFSTVTAAYHAHIGTLGPSQFDELRHWHDDMHMPAEVIVEAILAAKEVGKRRMSYICGILRNWHNDGVRTVDDAKKQRLSHTRRSRADPGDDIATRIAEVAKRMKEKEAAKA